MQTERPVQPKFVLNILKQGDLAEMYHEGSDSFYDVRVVCQRESSDTKESVVKPPNEPAFPTDSHTYEGMSLRDYFATKAPITIEHVVNMNPSVYGSSNEELFAKHVELCYAWADAMLKERLK